jgi:hypothetical protein
MMAATTWPNLLEAYQDDTLLISSILPFNKSRTRAIHRIGPHNLNILSIIICGLLGDW